MIDKIGHYSLTNPASVYDEEAMTALELAGRTAAKTNECVEVVNKMESELPGMVDNTTREYIKNGTFDEAIDEYADKLGEEIERFEASANARIDNIMGAVKPGGTSSSMDAEIIDARLDGYNVVHNALGASIRNQVKDAVNSYTGLVYAGANYAIDIKPQDDGSIKVTFAGRLSRYHNKGNGAIEWAESITPIEDKWVYAEGSEKRGTLTIPCYKSFVYNVRDGKYYIRNGGTCDTYDLLLIQNAYGNAVRGALVSEYHARMIESNLLNGYQVRGAYIYQGSGSNLIFTPNETDETLDVYFIGRPTLCYQATSKVLNWSDESLFEDIKDNFIYESETRATIKIPGWNALVFNHIDNKYHFRWRAGLKVGDILALATGYMQPLCGTMLEEWNTRRTQEWDSWLRNQTLSSNPPEALKTFAALFNDTNNVESFLFFTDPHLCESDKWQSEFEIYKTMLKTVYESAPVNFAICGGDWLGNSDTRAEACYKLGFIHKQMRAIFDRYYPVLGNHDTNYQGIDSPGADDATGRLSQETLQNLWFAEHGNTYYQFTGNKTRFLVFDSGIDWDTEFGNFETVQIEWAIDKLMNERAAHNAFAMHIGCMGSNEPDAAIPFTEQLTAMADAFNSRGTFTLFDRTYDFSGATGKVHFILSGHRHADGIPVINNIPVVITTETRAGGEPTFDLCLADYDKNVLSLVRVGTGEPVRTINI